ncbi:GIN domain-containing protein [Mucilaginibacter sp. HD30]
MKTQITTIIAAVALLVSTNITHAKADNGAVELTQVGDISKIEASGNVDVYLVNGDYDAVKIYDDYYGGNAVVKNEDGVLRIASYASEKLTVFVTVNDLQAITANNNASVRSYGDAFSAKGIDITLNDQAVAQLNIDAIGATITVNDEAHAEFAGRIENYELNYAAAATVNNDNLQSHTRRENKIEQPKPTRAHGIRFAMHASL